MALNPKQIHIFDMDGTLVDSKSATLQAYRQAAQQLNFKLPTNIWGHSAGEWRCPNELHVLKTRIYQVLSADIQPGWAAPYFAKAAVAGCTLGVWTAASESSVRALRSNSQLEPLLTKVRTGCTTHGKKLGLQALLICWPECEVHYYDDDTEAAQIITGGTRAILHLPAKEASCV